MERTFDGLSMLGREEEVGVEIAGSLRPATELSRGDAILVMMPSVPSCILQIVEDSRSWQRTRRLCASRQG